MIRTSVFSLTCLLGSFATALGQILIPHHQDRPPGPPLSPKEAIARMRTPPGFEVKLFIAEPDLVNPVAMTFDQRGRVWVTESTEYPRSSAGKGRDRVRILEDTDRDGKADRFTTFAEGLNIPSGILLGYGGVFVANAPDLLFLCDTDGDDRADTREVLLTGFGRSDTHELPNSLIWGPDGWLYGLNGVFNHSKVIHQGKTHSFTCALWRYHPRTKEFELFAEGTSNPWGLDYDSRGEFFVSACVIDHLWHLSETGYYHRQGGPYPPFTWKIGSIVGHKHQKAAYCGLCIYQSDKYPEEYRGQFLMGNIHGGCINCDSPERRGASYFATPRPDFLTANDVWFMPVAQKIGPDGCLWVLDWYDRYHCYQDAKRDSAGIDRLKGRLYRITYQGTPMGPAVDLRKKEDRELIELLGHANVYYRRWARQILVERSSGSEELRRLVFDESISGPSRMEALWTLISQGRLEPSLHLRLLDHADSDLRAWGVRTAGAMGRVEQSIRSKVLILAQDPHPDVRLQVAIAAGKIEGVAPLAVLMDVLSMAHEDPSGLTLRIVWQNLQPLMDTESDALVEWLSNRPLGKSSGLAEFTDRLVGRFLASEDLRPIFELLENLLDRETGDPELAGRCLETMLIATLNGELGVAALDRFRERLSHKMQQFEKTEPTDDRVLACLGFATLFEAAGAEERAIQVVRNRRQDHHWRILMLRALSKAGSKEVLSVTAELMEPGRGEPEELLVDLLAALSRSRSAHVASLVLAAYSNLPQSVRPQALDLLTSRVVWARELLDAVAEKRLPASAVNPNQLRKIISFRDEDLTQRVTSIWGRVRLRRAPNREQVIRRYRRVLATGHGDPSKGVAVYNKVCAQCHKLGGKGYEVGPDLTRNGTGNLEQILSNLLDPNLVIGKDYQARTIATVDGLIVTGLVVEDSPARVVLKVAGGKKEVFVRSQIDQMRDSEISLMPEDLEKQITEQQFRDLIAYLRQQVSVGGQQPAGSGR